eukprot:1146583-Pelagomonas_calceolata.AAC.1
MLTCWNNPLGQQLPLSATDSAFQCAGCGLFFLNDGWCKKNMFFHKPDNLPGLLGLPSLGLPCRSSGIVPLCNWGSAVEECCVIFVRMLHACRMQKKQRVRNIRNHPVGNLPVCAHRLLGLPQEVPAQMQFLWPGLPF